jgi:phage gp29-like protein
MAPPQIRVRYSADGKPWLSPRDLLEHQMTGGVPESEQYRRYFGRALTPATIEAVLQQASLGYMRDLTALTNETIFIDPHLGSVIGKRFRSLASMRVRVIPAEGDGIDPKLASELADVVRQQIAWIKNFKQHVLQLNWGHCFGRAALEKTWKENPAGSKVQWRVDSLGWIHPNRLSFGSKRDLRVKDGPFQGLGFDDTGLPMQEYRGKFITFTPQLFNEYAEREGFGPRALYWSFHKRFGQRERMVLLEVFGKPWRIVYTDNPSTQPDAMQRATEVVDNMGGDATAQLPPGVKVDTEQPHEKAGQNHRDVIADSNDEISKLVLGTTRTTDAKPSALGSAGDEVAQDEASLVIAADGWNVSDCLTEGLSVDIVAINVGPEYIDHAPRIEISYELPKNRPLEAETASKTLSLGIPLKEDEVYERTGWTKPQPGDRIIQQQPGAGPAMPGMPAPSTTRVGVMPGEENEAGGGGSPTGTAGDEDPAPDPLATARAATVLSLLAHTSKR